MGTKRIPQSRIAARNALFGLIVFGSWGALGYLGYRWLGWWGPFVVSLLFVVFHSLISSIVEGWFLNRLFGFRASDVVAQEAARDLASRLVDEEAWWEPETKDEPESEIVLAYDGRPGRQLEYAVSVEMRTEIFEAGKETRRRGSRAEMTFLQRVLETHEDGTMRLRLEMTGGERWEDEGPRQQLESVGQSSELVMRPNGEVVESTGPGVLTFPRFPRGPLHKGQVWERRERLTPDLLGDEACPEVELLFRDELVNIEQNAALPMRVAIVLTDCQEQPQGSPIHSIISQGRSRFTCDKGALVSSDVETTTEAGDEDLHTRTRTQVRVRLLSFES